MLRSLKRWIAISWSRFTIFLLRTWVLEYTRWKKVACRLVSEDEERDKATARIITTRFHTVKQCFFIWTTWKLLGSCVKAIVAFQKQTVYILWSCCCCCCCCCYCCCCYCCCCCCHCLSQERNLKFGWNRVSYSWDIAYIEFLWVGVCVNSYFCLTLRIELAEVLTILYRS